MLKSKTFWGGVTAIIGSVGLYATGELSLGDCLQTAVTSLLAIFLRHGIAKSTPPGP